MDFSQCFSCGCKLSTDIYGQYCPNESCCNLDGAVFPITTDFDIGYFKKISIPIVRKVYPSLIGDKIFGVQEMMQNKGYILNPYKEDEYN